MNLIFIRARITQLSVLLVLLWMVARVSAEDYQFTTIAGNAGFGSGDGTGSAARFNSPTSIVSDTNGSLYVADSGNHTIRRLTANGSNWVVSTIAGNPGFSGTNNGVSGAARFNNPNGVTVDAAGNVFVADAANNTIRKLSRSGADWLVTTIAGTPGESGTNDGLNAAARFNYPLGVFATTGGRLLVADTFNYTIRQLTSSGNDWSVTTPLGLPENSGYMDGTNNGVVLNSVIGLATESLGDFYLADNGGQTIRKVTLSGNNWSSVTIAGLPNTPGSSDGTNDTERFNGPTCIARDSAGNLFVTDWGNNAIRKLTPSGTNWVVSTIAGKAETSGSADGTNDQARFLQPYGIATDSNGNVFVSDQSNNTIRKLVPEGTNWVTTTIAGLAAQANPADGTNMAARFQDAHQAAVDGAGNIYLADSGSYAIRKLSKVGTNWVVTTIAGRLGVSGSQDGTNDEARFFYPYGLCLDAQTNLYVADTFNNTLRKIIRLGTNWITTTIAGSTSSSGIADGTNSSAQFQSPQGVAYANGKVYVADTSGHTIRQLTPVGTNWVVTTIAGTPNTSGDVDGTNRSARFFFAAAIAANASGDLFLADNGNHTIRRVRSAGTNWVVTTIAGLAGFAGSTDDTNQNARFNSPFGLTVAADGSLLVGDLGNYTLRKLTPEGTNWVTTTLGGYPGIYGSADGVGPAARFYGPQGVATDNQGRIFLICPSSVFLGETIATVATGPSLGVFASGNKVVLSWSSTANGYDLQTTSPLRSGSQWTNLSGATLVGANYFFTNAAATRSAFFRLHKP